MTRSFDILDAVCVHLVRGTFLLQNEVLWSNPFCLNSAISPGITVRSLACNPFHEGYIHLGKSV